MDKVEKMLSENKLELNKLEVPEDLENRLRTALKDKKPKIKTNRHLKIKIAAVLMGLILIGYNFTTLGFYAEKLTGYDQLMDGNLKKLNELGKGQTIGKSYTFKNGVTFTLDGVMLDDNQLLAFYTVKDSIGKLKYENFDASNISLKGKFNQYMFRSAYGNSNDKNTEIKFAATFDSPSAFDKNLVLSIVSRENNQIETGKIAFTLDKNTAMGHSIKKSLHKTIKTEDTNLRLQSISASPTTTVIKGSLENILELAVDRMKGITFSPSSLSINLVADGKILASQSGELSSNLDGITFKYNFDPLPGNLKKLQIQFVSLTSEHIVDNQFNLHKNIQNQNINVEGKNIEIKKIYETNENTYITFSTESDVILTKANIIMDGKKVELNKTIAYSNTKNANGTTICTRTMEFKGTGNNLKLDIQRMIYERYYNKTVDIIVN